MIVKGYLNEISVIELLKVVGKYSGNLAFWNFAEGKQFELFLRDGSLTYMNANGSRLTESNQVIATVKDLTNDRKSYYKFQSDIVLTSFGSPMIGVNELINALMSAEEPEEVVADDHLPNIDTRFETVNKLRFPLLGPLAEFWSASSELLHQGCSGRDICQETDFSESEIRKALYDLRNLGLIKPIRAFKAEISQSTIDRRVNRRPRKALVSATTSATNGNGSYTATVPNNGNRTVDQINDIRPTPPITLVTDPPPPDILTNLTSYTGPVIVHPDDNPSTPAAEEPKPIVETKPVIEPIRTEDEKSPFATAAIHDTQKTGMLKRMLGSLFNRR